MALIVPKAKANQPSQDFCDIWEDKEIRFDLPLRYLRLRPGEKAIDRLDSVEDTKGNGGDKGRLIITNLRILWHSLNSPRVSLCKHMENFTKSFLLFLCFFSFYKVLLFWSLAIGLSCITTATTKQANSKLRGVVEALYLLTKSGKNRLEFVFTNLIPGTTRLFTSVIGVHRAFSTSKMYRELKLRGAVVRDRQLQILPLEHIVSTEKGIWNVSSDQGNLGTFFITNVRIVWFADMNEHFNLSLPFMQIVLVKIRESKFGLALVLETSELSGGYVLGFRIDPIERLKNVYKEITALQAVFTKSPIFGVEYTVGAEPILPEEPPTQAPLEDEVDWNEEGVSSALTTYATEGADQPPQPPVFCPELGLAIEQLKEGYTIQSLWEILPQNC